MKIKSNTKTSNDNGDGDSGDEFASVQVCVWLGELQLCGKQIKYWQLVNCFGLVLFSSGSIIPCPGVFVTSLVFVCFG